MKNRIKSFAPRKSAVAFSKFATTVLLLVAVLIVGVTKAEALFINAFGSVDPTAGTITDNGSTTTFSQIDYIFNVVDVTPGFGMVNLQVTFEDDVFTSIGTASNLTSGWTLSSDTHPGLTHAHLSGSSVQSLAFSMLGVEVNNAALLDPSLWDEGGIWEQGWSTVVFDFSNAPSFDFTSAGGSTIPNPEPASLILMGTGLVGLGLWSRQRKKN